MLGKSPFIVMERARRAGLKTSRKRNQRWEFTQEDIEKIKAVEARKKLDRMALIMEQTGLSMPIISRLKTHCGLRFTKDYDKVLWACQKYATGFYTKEGIFYLLKTEYK